MKRLCALFLTVLFLSACAPKSAPEGSGSESASQPDPSASSSQQQEETMEPAMALTDLGVTLENYPRINGSTSTLGIVQAVYEGAGGNMQDENYPWEPLRTVPSYEALINGEVDLILVPYASPAVREQAQQAGVELEYSQVAAEALIFIPQGQHRRQHYRRPGAGDLPPQRHLQLERAGRARPGPGAHLPQRRQRKPVPDGQPDSERPGHGPHHPGELCGAHHGGPAGAGGLLPQRRHV